MRISWNKLQEGFVENASEPFAGLLPHLGKKLGLTPASLRAMGTGYAPLVVFKKTVSACWWTTPERDAEGNVVGISLRPERGGKKVMFPGSKHGLAYVVRPGYKTGSKAYIPGKQNFVRTMEAGLPCPVCGKPDGCLLSSENPADPQAVMCIRIADGAEGPGNVDTGGWLHIRKPEGRVTKGGPLEDSAFPYITVEGASDASAARDLGFVAVGRPSNLAGLGYLRDLLKGRSVTVIGENDVATAPSGKLRYPGREGMEAAFEALKNCCKVKKVMPPEGIKDLRDWVAAGLTRDLFLAYVVEHGSDQGDSRILESDEPVKIATRWLHEEHTKDGVPILRKFSREWYHFNGECYEPVEEEAYIRGGLYRWLLDRSYIETTQDGPKLKPYSADRGKVTNIIDALSDPCPLQAEPPCWLDARSDPDPKNMVAFPNGVLDVNAYLREGTTDLIPLSPLFFTFNALQYDFDPAAACPLFEKFIGEVLPDDPRKRMLLQEWCGYLLLPDTSQQKLMVFNGASGTGKTTLLFAIEAMLGSRQVCHPSLTGFGQEFGMAQMVGKLAAFIGDAEMDRSANRGRIMERLKELTGSVHPVIEVRRMHIAETPMHIFARITIACNDLPDLPDSGGALPRRTLALHFTEKFESATRQPDRQLPDKLAAEAPGIFNWALVGLERLRRQGYFTIPESSETLAKKFSANSSPLVQFIDECCDVSSGLSAAEETLFAAWRNYAKDHGLSSGMRLKFQHNLMNVLSTVRFITDLKDGIRIGGFMGIGLTRAAKEKYLT